MFGATNAAGNVRFTGRAIVVVGASNVCSVGQCRMCTAALSNSRTGLTLKLLARSLLNAYDTVTLEATRPGY